MPRPIAALVILISVLFGCAAWPANTSAQAQSPITLNVHAGYDGAYRLGEWFPVQVDVGNDGPDISAVVEWTFPGQPEEQTFQRAIDLPRGARKRVIVDVLANTFARNGLVRLLAGSGELARQAVSLESFDESIFLIGVISSDPALLNSLDAQQLIGFSNTRVRHIDPGLLPEAAAELRALNALFLHDLDTAALNPAQREAIGLWLSQGGQLFVSGGVSGQKSTAGLADLLPVQGEGALAEGALAPLGQVAASSAPPPAATTALSQVQPRPNAEELPPNSGLLYRWRYGSGTVVFSGFDFASLRGWPAEGALWGKLLLRQATLIPSAALNQFNLLDRGVLKLPSLNLPSAFTILLFLLIYVLVIGPLNYVVLRRMQRLELAWITIPVIVVTFAVGLYAVGRVLRGGQPQFNQVAVVQGVEGQSRGGATSFIGLFSPSRTSYTLTFPATTLVSSGTSRAFLTNRLETIQADEAGARSIDVLADVASVTTFVAETAIDLPLAVQSNLVLGATGVRGEIRNTGSTTLQDVTIVRGETFAKIGTLAPGASQQIGANAMQSNFPNGLSLADAGVFDRQAMVNLLFDRDALRFQTPSVLSSGLADTGSAYLLAWINQPTTEVGVNGQAATQNGLTLYVIRLRAAAGG